MAERHSHPHPSPNATLQNWRQPMPLGRKVSLAWRNTWYKIRHRTMCCDHPGEPGC